MDYYICPVCKAKNDEHQKYCPKCGTWLLSTRFPAKKISAKHPIGFSSIVALLMIGFVVYIGFSQEHSVSFDKIQIGDSYTLSQLKVTNKPSANADFTTHIDVIDPLEVVAVFYDESGNRLAKATALVLQQLPKDQTTTLTFKFDEVANLNRARSVRVEVIPLSPLMLLERAANAVK